jgi:predicted PurR-regulated permease PerM
MIGVLVGIGFSIIPPLVTEVKELAINLPIISAKLGPINRSFQAYTGNYQENLFNLSSQIGNLTTGIFSTTLGFVSGVFAFIMIIVLSFYMLVDQESTSAYFYKLLSPNKREEVGIIIKKISVKMGQWLGGNLLLMLFIGALDLIALMVLGVPYALILAIWGGLVEVIPYLGPWLGLVPAVLIALTVSPLTALFVAIAFIIIQQLESNIIAPKIISRAIGLSPVIIILSLLIGAKLLGLLGIIIAVPTAAIISVFINEWSEIKQLNK